jgi:hypothetical protein
MNKDYLLPEPILFNPLKHYLFYIREFINSYIANDKDVSSKDLIMELKHLGNCVIDIYTGEVPMIKICNEVMNFLKLNQIADKEHYRSWAGTNYNSFRIISLSDGSQWTLKYYTNETRYVHIFPARLSSHTFRIKANTLKSAILYMVVIGKDFITEDDLNRARALNGLSPIKDVADSEAITEMIEILRATGSAFRIPG